MDQGAEESPEQEWYIHMPKSPSDTQQEIAALTGTDGPSLAPEASPTPPHISPYSSDIVANNTSGPVCAVLQRAM